METCLGDLSDIDDIYDNASFPEASSGIVLSLRLSTLFVICVRECDVRPRLRIVSASSSRPALCTDKWAMSSDLVRMHVALSGQSPRWGAFKRLIWRLREEPVDRPAWLIPHGQVTAHLVALISCWPSVPSILPGCRKTAFIASSKIAIP